MKGKSTQERDLQFNEPEFFPKEHDGFARQAYAFASRMA
jgi:hypothetical protein